MVNDWQVSPTADRPEAGCSADALSAAAARRLRRLFRTGRPGPAQELLYAFGMRILRTARWQAWDTILERSGQGVGASHEYVGPARGFYEGLRITTVYPVRLPDHSKNHAYHDGDAETHK